MQWTLNPAGTWSGVTWSPRPATMPIPVDPYMVWADCSNFVSFGGPRATLPVMIEIAPSMKVAVLAPQLVAARLLGSVPNLYTAAAPAVAGTRFFTAEANVDFFHALKAGDPSVAGIVRCEISRSIEPLPGMPTGGIDTSRIPAGLPLATPAPDTFVGIIDDALPIANTRYRDMAGLPRVWSFWDQSAGAVGPVRPGVVPYGYELDRSDLNDALVAAMIGGVVDEELFYQQIKYNRNRRRETHGAAVMDLLCGEPVPVPADAPGIIGVQLPSSTVADTSGLALAVNVLDGVRHIIDRAMRLNPNASIIINLSLGEIAGPHDGSSMLESALDELVAILGGRLQLFIAAGNNYLSRAHARTELATGASRDLHWRLLPDDETPSFVELWLPAGVDPSARGLEVILTPPVGPASPAVSAGQTLTWSSSPLGPALYSITFLPPASLAPPAGRAMILIALAPTASLTTTALAPFGRWTITLRRPGKPDDKDSICIDAWIQRDDTPFGYRRYGRQSFFDDPNDVRFDAMGRLNETDSPASYVRRAGSLNSLASQSAIAGRSKAVGGYRRGDNYIPNYVSAGQSAVGTSCLAIAGPNLMAPCEDSPVLHGVLAAGTHTGSMMRLNGTSVASPQAARLAAAAGLPAAIGAAGAIAFRQKSFLGKPVAAMPVRGGTPIFGTQRNARPR